MPVYPVTQALTVDTPSYKENDPYLISKFHMAAFFSAYMAGNGDLVESYENESILKSALKTDPELEEVFSLEGLNLPEVR